MISVVFEGPAADSTRTSVQELDVPSRVKPRRVLRALRCVLAMLEVHVIDVPIQMVHSLADVGAVHDRLAGGHNTGKFVVDVNGQHAEGWS